MGSQFPNPQARSGQSFIPAPLDGSLTIPEVYDFNLHNNGIHPLFVYDTPDGVQTISWGKAGRAIHNAAMVVSRSMCAAGSKPKVPVVAILANTDQFSYFALTAGIMRAGYLAFPISPRNSDVGVANLLQKTGAQHVFVSQDQAMQKLISSARERAAEGDASISIDVLPVPSFEELYVPSNPDQELLPPMPKRDTLGAALILHSSVLGGSTSFPKPIVLSHRNLLQWGSQPYYGEVDLCGRILSNHALPFFHAMGIVSYAGLPPAVSTPDRVYVSAINARSKLIFCVPTFLEASTIIIEWSQDPVRVSELQKFDAVLFGGAPIQKAVGDTLHAQGVKLYPFYGATEIGGTSKEPPAEGWEYFSISAHANAVLVDEEDKGISRIVFPHHIPRSLQYKGQRPDAYDTNDLIIRHPTNPKLWKIFGRSDDQIMHSTGEKTNPVPIETIINRHPMVSGSLVFGRGRFQAGVLIEPKPEYALDSSDLEQLASFRNNVWSSVEEANNFAPSHSRIFKEVGYALFCVFALADNPQIILCAHPSKPFQLTPKGTPKRQSILKDYEQEIENGYLAIEESSQTDILLPRHLGAQESLVFARGIVHKIMMTPLSDNEDIFQMGATATWIRNIIIHALRESPDFKISAHKLPINFVYTNPTIQRLGEFISQISNQGESNEDATTDTILEMNALVEKYSANFPNTGRADSNRAGSTGGLGSYVLEGLLLDPRVTRVYALNRIDKAGRTVRGRQRAGFLDRGINISLLSSYKLVLLEGDTSKANFGMDCAIYESLRESVTCIMHTAWRVDFNVAISSMEPLIAGTRRLVDFALSSPHPDPPKLVFTSSIGVVRNWTEGVAPEREFPDAAVAVGSGYPESKWVAERVLTLAAKRTPLSPVIVRIGQLSGGRNGSWNPDEWVPSIVRSGQTLKCLPRAEGYTSWVPVNIAADALLEMRLCRDMFFHLVHPDPVLWSSLFESISSLLEIPLVSYPEWLSALEASMHRVGSDEEAAVNPALRLLDFYQSANKPLASGDAEALGFPRLSTTIALGAISSLQPGKLRRLGRVDVEQWLTYWKSLGLIEGTSSIPRDTRGIPVVPFKSTSVH
ncbi:hypothetical protein BD779DRAFT_1675887 [Infundibulicybe gibba]|nr:hypothetical protein BD779DRAFT_1675887 [Infundibulicybe gibba]